MKTLITFATIAAGFNFMSVDGNCMNGEQRYEASKTYLSSDNYSYDDFLNEPFNNVKEFCRIFDEEKI